MNKHILFILDYYLPHKGGSETVFEAIISRLLAKGYTISLITSHFDRKLPKEEHEESFHVYRVGGKRISFMFWAFLKGIHILKKDKSISLIHTSTYGGALPAALLGKVFHKRVVLTVHEIFGKLRIRYKGRWKGTIYRFFEKTIFWLSYDCYHCVSRYTMNSLRMVYGIPDKKIKMIYNGVDINFRNTEEVSAGNIKDWRNARGRGNRCVITYFGHAGKSKGLDYLVGALSELVTVDPQLLFVFNLIDSQRTEYIKEKIRKYHLGSSVQIFDGLEKNDLRILVASSSLIVAPSLSEGFGSVHTETVAMGKPLLTTYIASIPEVVRGNVKFISPASKREIIDAILQRDEWIDNPDYTLPSKEFSWNTTVKELIKLYH